MFSRCSNAVDISLCSIALARGHWTKEGGGSVPSSCFNSPIYAILVGPISNHQEQGMKHIPNAAAHSAQSTLERVGANQILPLFCH